MRLSSARDTWRYIVSRRVDLTGNDFSIYARRKLATASKFFVKDEDSLFFSDLSESSSEEN